MLDKLTASVLAAVNAQTDGSYKVLEEGEILAALPPRIHTDGEGLANALRYLSERGYIDIRYSDKGTYCVCSLPKGRTYAETSAAEKGEKKVKGRFWAIFFGAFAGGLYMMWLVIGYGMVRKPGTATLIGIVQAFLVMFTGVIGSHGIMSLFTYIMPGMVMDIVLLIIGHRACCRACCVIAGAAANMTGTACVNVVFFPAPGMYLILILSVAALSGAIGGYISWELLRVADKYHMIKNSTK